MLIIKEVMADGQLCPVTISDESEALSAAAAAGRAIVGIWEEESAEESDFGRNAEETPDEMNDKTDGFSRCLYLVPSWEEVTEQLLERAARRHLDLPWKIGETKRLLIREFASGDPLEPESENDGGGVFSHYDRREAYRRSQYRFAECGLWALVEKESGHIVGKAGITGDELGYHIYPDFRGKGYGEEACREILRYAGEELALSEVTLKVREDNLPSRMLAEKLGFQKKESFLPEEKESYCILYAQRI